MKHILYPGNVPLNELLESERTCICGEPIRWFAEDGFTFIYDCYCGRHYISAVSNMQITLDEGDVTNERQQQRTQGI